MRHEKFDAEGRESSNFKLLVLGVAIIVLSVKFAIDKYIATSKAECVYAGVREADRLKECVNRRVYGTLYPHMPDVFLLGVEDVRIPENVAAGPED